LHYRPVSTLPVSQQYALLRPPPHKSAEFQERRFSDQSVMFFAIRSMPFLSFAAFPVETRQFYDRIVKYPPSMRSVSLAVINIIRHDIFPVVIFNHFAYFFRFIANEKKTEIS
jgi:hypothetical protein